MKKRLLAICLVICMILGMLPMTAFAATTEITFNLGANGSASHADGSSKTTYSETVSGYTLSLTGGTNMYTGARDAKGNSCIKLGTSSKTGGFSFTVPADVTTVIVAVAKYKTNTTKIAVNGTNYTLSGASNNGAYDEIEVDTSSTKTVTLTTVSGGVRAMVNSITYVIETNDGCEHANKETTTVESSCTVAGSTTVTCKDCDEVISTEEIPATGHTAADDGVITPPTCTAKGYTTYTCDECGEEYDDDFVPANGHSYADGACTACGEAQPEKATITFDDTSKRTELSTSKQVWQENSITVTNNKHQSTTNVADYAKPARFYKSSQLIIEGAGPNIIKIEVATTGGEYLTAMATSADAIGTVTTSGQNVIIIPDEPAPSYAITLSEGQVRVNSITIYYATQPAEPECTHESATETIVKATCTTDGSKTVTCDDCGETISDEVIPATGHSYEAVVTAPNCENGGYTTYTCTVCGDSYTADETSATGHSYKAEVTAPDCENGGHTTYTCTVCGDSYTADETSATGHSYEAVVTAPNCENGGYTTYTCTVCGDSYTADETSATGHSYKAEVTAPDCENGGYTTYTCTVCGDNYTADETEATGHSYKAEVTAPTCTEKGYTTYTCTVTDCGHSYTADETEATGHSYEAVVTPPSFDAGGYTTYTCTVCGHSYTADETPALVGVAQIGETKYTSLQAALDAAKDNDVVKLLRDVKVSNYLDIYTPNDGETPREFTLDLNGYTISKADDYKYEYYPLLFVGINQTVTLTGGTITSDAYVTVGVYGVLKLENAIIECTGDDPDDDAALCIWHWDHNDPGYEGVATGAAEISGGNIVGGLFIEGDTAISGGDIDRVTVERGQTTITGGTFGHDVKAYCAVGYTTVEVDGRYTVEPCIHADYTCTDNGDGTHAKTCTICEETITEAEAHSMKPETGNCSCGLDMAVASTTVGGTTTYYEALKDAIAAAAVGTEDAPVTVKVLKDIDMTETINVVSGVFTLNLNGMTLRDYESKGLDNGLFQLPWDSTAHMTIADTGGGKLLADWGVVEVYGGTVTITGGAFDSEGVGLGSSVSVRGGTVNISGGTIEDINADYGTVNISGGSIETIDLREHTTGNISGGTIWLLVVESTEDNVKLSGGAFVEIHCENAVSRLLDYGYSYWNHDGTTMRNPAEDTDIFEVIVKATCYHPTEKLTYKTCDSSTHTWHCADCNNDITEAHTASATYALTADGTQHIATYGCCNGTVTEAHTFGDVDTCGCGVKAKAKNKNTGIYYATLAEALEQAKMLHAIYALADFDGAFTIPQFVNFYGEEFTFSGEVTNEGAIQSGTFTAEVINNCNIYNGTFQGKVTTNLDSSIHNGTFNGEVSVEGSIRGGTFNNVVNNHGAITGGTFNNTVINTAGIHDGIYQGEVINNAKILGGTFNGTLTNNEDGQIWNHCTKITIGEDFKYVNAGGTVTGDHNNTSEANCQNKAVCSFCGEYGDVDLTKHNYEAVVTEPDCENGGYTTYTCADCGDSYEADETSALGHKYEAVVTEPDCENGGYTTHTCANCGDSYTDSEVAELGHNYSDVVVPPTCDMKGFTVHSCSRCDYSLADSYVDELGHDYETVVTKPDCENGGYTTYTCTVCGHSYVGDETPALGHDLSFDCYCNNCYEHIHNLDENCFCARCAYYQHTPTSRDDCTCLICGAPHAYENDNACFCTNCYKVIHDLDENCTCTRCGEEHHSGVDSATGICVDCGQFAAAVSVTADGVKTYYLTCKEGFAVAQQNENCTLRFENNFWDESDIDISGTFTVDLNGKQVYIGSLFMKAGEITMRDSVGGGTVSVALFVEDGTMRFEGGEYDGYIKGKGDGSIIVTDGEYYMISFLYDGGNATIYGGYIRIFEGYKGDNITIYGGSFGLIEGDADNTLDSMLADGHCYYNRENKKVDTSSIEMINGKYTLVNVTVSCDHMGNTQNCQGYLCERCGEYFGEGDPNGHEMVGGESKAPTCEEPGFKSHVCNICGHTETVETPATGHDWKPATCSAPETCGNCGETRGDVKNHAWGDRIQVTAPTCEDKGVDKVVCGDCGAVSHLPVDALGHKYEAVVTEPDCENGGYTTYTCTVCGDSYVGDETPALGHDLFSDCYCDNCRKFIHDLDENCFCARCESYQHTPTSDDDCTCLICGVPHAYRYGDSCRCDNCREYIHDLDEYCTCTRCGEAYHSGVDSATGNCVDCGQFVAAVSVTADGAKTYYYTFEEGLAVAQQNENCTLRFENDFSTTDNVYASGTFTIDLNGKCGFNSALHMEAGYVTLCDSVGGGDYSGGIFASGGTLRIESGYYSTYINCKPEGNVIITGGEIERVSFFQTGGSITIYGGSFNRVWGDIDHPLDSMLADGHCYYDADNKKVDTASIEMINGKYMLEDVTVSCDHMGNTQNCLGYLCERCGEYFGEGDPNDHEMVGGESKAPTCEEPGFKSHVCNICGHTETVETPATGHDWKPATCSAPETCGNCGETRGDVKNHAWGDRIQVTAPTCEDKGVDKVVCGDCGAVSHLPVDALGHKYEAVVTDPDCVNDGYTTYTCTVCGDSYVANEVSALGHEYEAVVTDPDCVNGGYTTYTCTVCGHSYVGDEVSALGHEYEAVVTNPDCVNGGYTTYTCAVCGDSYVADEVSALGHEYETVVTEPDCENGGYTTYTCTVCGDSYVADEVSALGHKYEAVVTDPDCENGGYTTYTCANCGDSYVADEVSALGHEYEAVVTDPDCENDGYTTYTCTVCGDSYVADEVPALGHKYEAVVTEPDCGNGGYTTYTCTVCGDSYVADEVSALGHKYEAVVTDPDCTEYGYTTYTCAVCGDSYMDDVTDPLGHKYEATEVVAPDCENSGYTTYTCANCGDSHVADEVPALGHKNVPVYTAPDCENVGYTTYTCANCGDSYVTNEIPALGHDYQYGSCDRCGAEDPEYVAPEYVQGMTMTLGNSLAINFVVDEEAFAEGGYYAVITKQYADGTAPITVTVPQSDWEVYDEGRCYFTFFGVKAKEMTDTIEVLIYNADGKLVCAPYERTVADYCLDMVERYEQPGMFDAERLALYVDILNYGAAAQDFFGYNTEDLANADLTDAQRAYASKRPGATDIRVKGAGYAGSTLSLLNEIQLNFVYNNNVIDKAAYAVVSYTHHCGAVEEYTVEAADFQAYGTMRKYVEVNGLKIADGGQVVTVTLYDASGNVLSVSQDSMNAYAVRKGDEHPVYDAVLKLTESAYNYFH